MNQVVAFSPVTEELLQEAVRQILSVGSKDIIVWTPSEVAL
jgi:hypothetical protein